MATYIKQKTEEGSLGNYAAHGLLGAGVAALQGNSALAGAVGAAGGEYTASAIREHFYDGKDNKDLTESEKESISNWSQIASGAAAFAGSGGSLNNVSTAVSASKNAVENNFLNLLSGAGVGLVSGGVNLGFQLLSDKNVNWSEVGISTGAGFIAGSTGIGLLGVVGVNSLAGAAINYTNDEDMSTGAVVSGVASSLGYGLGGGLKNILNKLSNPNYLKYMEKSTGYLGVTSSHPTSPMPTVVAEIIDASASEYTSYEIGKKVIKKTKKK